MVLYLAIDVTDDVGEALALYGEYPERSLPAKTPFNLGTFLVDGP